MQHLSIDIETFSGEPIARAGLYRYAQSPDFDILLFGYSPDGGRTAQSIDLTQPGALNKLPVALLYDPSVVKHAWNAAFEWYCLSVWLRRHNYPPLPPEQWQDSMLHALYCGLPAGLDACGKALGLPEDKRKLSCGKALIRTFSVPRKPTARDPRTRVLPADEPDKWAMYLEYNRQDVLTECAVDAMLAPWPVPDWVQRQWVLDLRQNARGVGVDRALVDGALRCAAQAEAGPTAEAKALTGLDNPNSPTQLLPWLKNALGEAAPAKLDKEAVADALAALPPDAGTVRRVLELRQELSKTSTKKYDAMAEAVCADGRIRGIMQFYGANRTGRYAGRIVQPQNLPRTHLPHLDAARALAGEGDADALRLGWGSVSDTLSQLIRTAFVPRPGCRFIDADFSAIEARVIAWLAGEEWVLEVFRTTGKIYEATAAQMFGVPAERIVKGRPEYELRQRGKVAQLACGYQGSAKAMARMDTGHKIDPAEYPALVQKWRDANPAIVRLWAETERAAHSALGGVPAWVRGRICFRLEAPPGSTLAFLTAQLPSGRKLFYFCPHKTKNRFGKPALAYWGVDQQTRKWVPVETYGGKLVENLVQAIARDLLCEKIEALEAQGFPVVFSVHDEVIVERPAAPDGSAADFAAVKSIMAAPVSWAPGLPLDADGWVGDYYTKE